MLLFCVGTSCRCSSIHIYIYSYIHIYIYIYIYIYTWARTTNRRIGGYYDLKMNDIVWPWSTSQLVDKVMLKFRVHEAIDMMAKTHTHTHTEIQIYIYIYCTDTICSNICRTRTLHDSHKHKTRSAQEQDTIVHIESIKLLLRRLFYHAPTSTMATVVAVCVLSIVVISVVFSDVIFTLLENLVAKHARDINLGWWRRYQGWVRHQE